mmetsp:Transcript_18687/g.54442  ORF Transcript_18687/g.54442 Transcript_18687/m.54442 type:complete len:305 (-) Transcript_18687:581-1495(-)
MKAMVPVNVRARDSSSNSRRIPKSESFTRPRWSSKMFDGLMSRCMRRRAWSSRMPWRQLRATWPSWASFSRRLALRGRSRAPELMYSRTRKMHRSSGSVYASYICTMKGATRFTACCRSSWLPPPPGVPPPAGGDRACAVQARRCRERTRLMLPDSIHSQSSRTSASCRASPARAATERTAARRLSLRAMLSPWIRASSRAISSWLDRSSRHSGMVPRRSLSSSSASSGGATVLAGSSPFTSPLPTGPSRVWRRRARSLAANAPTVEMWTCPAVVGGCSTGIESKACRTWSSWRICRRLQSSST